MARTKSILYNPKYLATIVSFLASPLIASAALPTTCAGLVSFIENIAKSISAIIFVIAVIMLLYAAFLFLTGGGNEETQKSARGYLIYAVIGLVVALFAFTLPGIVESVLTGTRGTCQ